MSTAKPGNKGIKPQVIDRRIADRLVARGTLSQGDLDELLKKLPDVEDNAENIASKIFGDKP